MASQSMISKIIISEYPPVGGLSSSASSVQPVSYLLGSPFLLPSLITILDPSNIARLGVELVLDKQSRSR